MTDDLHHLERCLQLAEEALAAGDHPFGSRLVARNGEILREARNRVETVDGTRHPEFDLARWAGEHLSPPERRTATVFTSGEHCPMCAAAHAWVGLGRIVFASSCAQLVAWRHDFGAPDMPVAALPVSEIAPSIPVEGPFDALAERVRALHARHCGVG